MGVGNKVIAILRGEDSADVVLECRRCGRTVAPETVRCPECETESIARYEIPP